MITFAAALLGILAALPVLAQSETDPTLSLELNRVDQMAGACRFTFLSENRMGVELTAFTIETVIIDAEGVVERLTLFEFGTLPDGTPRVRQFDVPDLTCADVGGILVNGVSDCGGVQDCGAAMVLSNRTDIDLTG